jgi:hypothetical protein
MDRTTITLRLDADVYQTVKEKSGREGRSRNAQINHHLKTLKWSDSDMIDWALTVLQRKGNPPYVLEDLRKQLRRELGTFKSSRT